MALVIWMPAMVLVAMGTPAEPDAHASLGQNKILLLEILIPLATLMRRASTGHGSSQGRHHSVAWA
jgi:hypothetical protein